METLAPRRGLRRPVLAAAAAVQVAALVLLAWPSELAAGWRHVLHGDASRLPGVRASDTPIVGDIEITLEFPAYTGRPPLALPASSGDFRALAGTVAHIETTALVPAVEAELVFEDESTGELALHVDGDRLSGAFTVTDAAAYRFLLRRSGGAATAESRPHVIELEPDAPPRVELYAPADELDVTDQKRIELAYTAEDDFGLLDLALVWTPEGGEPGRMALPPPGPERRAAQGKFLWDLAGVPLPPGARVTYHIEARDNDDVRGPNVGRSRSFALRVFSPRERQEQLVARQQEAFEQLLRLLGARLVAPGDDLEARRELHRQATALVGLLGAVVADAREGERAGRDLVEALADIHARLDKLARAERDLLGGADAPGRRGRAPAPARLAANDRKQIAELERDALLLADWLDRQRLEAMNAITDEIRAGRERLKELFEEYARTGSAETLAEIQRELRALEQRMAELDEERGQLGAETLDRFMNLEAVTQDDARSCVDRVRTLLEAGDVAGARAEMEKCSGELDQLAGDLEQSLAELRGDKFSEQQQRLEELIGEVADLAHDQDRIADEADRLTERYAEAAAERLAGAGKEVRARASETIAQLRKRLEQVPRDGLTPYSQEELPVAEQRLGDVEEMLEDGDLAAALEMARQAARGLESVEAELGADVEGGEPWNERTAEARDQVGRAVPLARGLVEQLEQATPSPGDIMSGADQEQLRRLRKQQQAVRERTKKLGQRARQAGAELPGEAAEAMSRGLDGAAQQMDAAERRMKAGDPSGSRQQARGAADKLEQLGKDARGAARQQIAGRGMRDEPVRIPGADEYKAPAEFREEILEAMKKQAPDGFGEQVKRYYEELIR
jgi:hypothetical protein